MNKTEHSECIPSDSRQ